MTKGKSKVWSLSAELSYGGLFYSKLMRYYDGYILGMTGGIIKGSTVFEVGAGAANFGFEAIKAGAGKVIVIENNLRMVRKIERKKNCDEKYQRIEIVTKDMYSGVISEQAVESKPKIIHFKRCLYGSVSEVKKVLRESYDALEKDGFIFIIHPEKGNRLYDDDGFGKIAIDHFLKRHINKLGVLFENHSYVRYSQRELEEICRDACPIVDIKFLPNSRPAYHFVAIKK